MLVNDGLSPALFAAIKRRHESYSRTGYLSTTSAIDSPRVRVLTNRHEKEIVIPASRLVPSFIGNCVHSEIEKYEATWEIDGIVQEKEFVTEVLGIKFSGRPDWYDMNAREVGDEKTSSTWAYVFNPEGKPEHRCQLHINGFLIRKYGYPCERGWVEYIFTDWKLSSAMRDSKYPRRVEIVHLDRLWDDNETLRYIEDRVRLHLAADGMSDANLPLCTPSEQWKKPHEWAVYRTKDHTRATKICDSLEDAEAIARSIGKSAHVEEREGERTRCEYHCDVKDWCNQYKEETSRVQEAGR